MPRAASRKNPPVGWPPLPEGTVLLALDASSTAVGFSVFDGPDLRVAGLIAAAPKGWDKVRRASHNAQLVVALIEEHAPSVVAMEYQSHKTAGGPRVQGLATLGQAQGWIAAFIYLLCPDVTVEYPSERDWTAWPGRRANVSKVTRAARIAGLFPDYAAVINRDDGLDCADAIGIALWRINPELLRLPGKPGKPGRRRRKGD